MSIFLGRIEGRLSKTSPFIELVPRLFDFDF